MSAEPKQDGPLVRLMRGLGLDAELAPIAAVKRIEETPKRLGIYECKNCGYQFPWEATCPECNSADLVLFMEAPPRSEIRHHAADREWELTEMDPDWREHFGDDVDRAWDFYKPAPPRPRMGNLVSGGGGVQPPEYDEPRYVDPDEAGFDADLTDRDE